MSIIEIISALCVQKKITITALERELGLSKGSISKWKVSSPKAETVLKMADYFGVSVDYLLGRTENPLPETKKEATEITFDDFTYAFYNESKNLSEEQKAALLNMAKLFNEQLNKEE